MPDSTGTPAANVAPRSPDSLSELPLSRLDVLRDEAREVLYLDLPEVPSTPPAGELPRAEQQRAVLRAMNAANASALCLSGGGIRSASFALGVVQALATYPRQGDGRPAATADSSLLARFDYLSTVSGGGYLGSWLSASITRLGFDRTWASLAAPGADEPADRKSVV